MKKSRGDLEPGLLLILLWAALWLPGCDGHTGLRGQVRDEFGKPVLGATIALSTSSRTVIVKSNDAGQYHVGMMHAPFKTDLRLTATKDQFLPFEKRFSSADHLQSLDITLRRFLASKDSPR